MMIRRLRPIWILALLLGGLAGSAWSQEELARELARLAPVFGEPTLYQRQGLESIYAIARRSGVSASAIHNANEGDLLAGGELILIPTERIAPVPWGVGLVVNLTERNAYWYENGRPVRFFPMAIGMRGWETPTGEFTIVNKRKNPTWFPPKWALEERPVPPGPDNPLGDRWMGLSEPGYGIHATNAPASIGRYVSHGCMRMYPEQAHELYELAAVGTPVHIVYERVVLGYRPEEGIVYMALHPDPYELGEVKPEHVRERLKGYGLAQVVDMSAVERALEMPRGVPTAVIGSRTKVRVNGRGIAFALAPTRVEDDWLVPAGPLLQALGARMELGPRANYVAISREGDRIFFSPGDAEALISGQMVRLAAAPQLAAGYPMIPLRATATALGASVGWEEQTQTVLVWDGLRMRPGNDVPEF